jgi:hypothetical protein
MNKDISSQLFTLPASNSKHYLILFLLWPFLAFLLALKRYSQKESRRVVYIFLIYYGLTYFINTEQYMDSLGSAMRLKADAALPFSDFFKIVGGLYTSDTSVDIIQPLISFIVSRFTSHHSILFAVYAALFGFFYLKSINLLHDRYQEKPGLNAMIFMAFFVVILPITAITGFRMWTAAWIFFYGAYHVILYRDARFLILALGSSLVHFSFLSANVILIIYFFVGNRNFIYLPLAIVSFVVPQLFSPVFQSISLRLGGALQDRFEGYSNVDYIIGIKESYEHAAWFLTLSNDLVFYYFFLAIFVIQLRYGFLMKEKAERNLFSFFLLFLSFVNFGKGIPSFGGRFQIILLLFATLYVFLYFLKQAENKTNLLTWVGLFPMVLYAAVTFRVGSESISAWIFTPGLGLPLFAPVLSIADFLFH